MKKLLLILFCLSLLTIAQKNERNHTLDYIMITFSEWDNYISKENMSLLSYKKKTNIETKAQIKYYHKNKLIYDSPINLRLSGNASRTLPQKSIAVRIIDEELQTNRFLYNLFPNREYNDIQEFIIRAHGNQQITLFNDAIANISLLDHTNLESSVYRPVILYINEKYHGLYNIREKKDKDFLSALHNLNKKEIILLELVANVFKPNNNDWDNLMYYCLNNDLSKDEHYNYVAAIVDIDNFIDYIIAQCFFANTDWPNNNVKIWKTKNSKFRFMFFDCDRGMINTTFNQIEHITGEDQWAKERGDKNINQNLIKNTTLIRSLSRNNNFCRKFALRYQDLLNTAFTTQKMYMHIEHAQSLIENEIENHVQVWRATDIYSKERANKSADDFNRKSYRKSFVLTSYDHWKENVSILKNFFKERPAIEFQHLQQKWDFGNLVDLKINVNDKKNGGLLINTINGLQYDIEGKFLNKLPINLEAVARPGYQFDYWEGIDSKESKIMIQTHEIIGSKITAHFKLID